MIKSVMLPIIILLPYFPLLGQELFHSVSGRISSAIVRIETEENVGSGFIVRDDGTIVTALGIIDGAAHVKVTTENRKVYDNVSLLAKDERRGIAIIRTAGFGLPNVDFGDSDNLEEQQILMIGRTFAANGMSLTTRLGRVLGVSYSDRGHKIVLIADPIPDEAIGGPIVDTEGRVIAIAVFQEDWKSAIPINDVRGLLDYVKHNQPILQWGSEHGAERPWSRFFVFWRGILTTVYSIYPWLIVFLVTVFVVHRLTSLLYSHWANKAEKHPSLAPISVSGALFADFSARDAVTEIDASMFEIAEITSHQKRDMHETKIASLSRGVDIPGEMIRRLVETPDDIQLPHQGQPTKVELPDVADIGVFKIPIRAIVTFAKILFGWIPMRSRERYRNALIHVSLMSVGSEAHLRVWRGGQYLSSSVQIDSEGSDVESNQTTVYGRIGDLTLLRDAVFMILELTQDKELPGRNWLSKKYFMEGLEYLDRSLRTCQPELMTKAVESFFHAAEADDKNHAALYIKGHILGARREEYSNMLAVELLNLALDTKNAHLKALIHAGLANCHAQQHFRLAMHKTEVMEKARTHIKNAYEFWKQTGEKQPHAWILAADAFVQVLEAKSRQGKESIKRYRKVAKLYFQAIKLEEKNSAYFNALGFVLLSLTEQRCIELKNLGIPPKKLKVPQLSEYYLRGSLELDPSNKLAYANLCLLYATDWYRNEDREKYLELSRNHGLNAVELDPKYVHGFRDLAKSLLRYGEIKESHSYFKKAINLARDSKKKKEIKCEVESILDEMGISKERWCDSVM